MTGRGLSCVEVGGGSVQTVVFRGAEVDVLDGAHQPAGSGLALAVPGIIGDGIVVEASNLGWRNVDPVAELGLPGPALVLANDGEAAALGEAALRGGEALERVVYVGVGTGIGGAVVRDGVVVRSNLFGHNANGHGAALGDLPCRCGRTGCLETVAAGWALPDPIDDERLADVASAIAMGVSSLPLAREGIVVVGGGIPRRYPELIALLRAALPHRRVEETAAPLSVKSAAAWGLRHAVDAHETDDGHTLRTGWGFGGVAARSRCDPPIGGTT